MFKMYIFIICWIIRLQSSILENLYQLLSCAASACLKLFVTEHICKCHQPMASSSSMNIIAGFFSLANEKASLTSLAPSPINICTSCGPASLRKVDLVWAAQARASRVLPVPGGPYNKTPEKYRNKHMSIKLETKPPRKTIQSMDLLSSAKSMWQVISYIPSKKVAGA